MLKASNISKSYGDRAILTHVSFVVNAGERLGVVATNGAGKTTLLDILGGVLSPDGGSVLTETGARIAYVRQGFTRVSGNPVASVLPRVFAAINASSRIEQASVALARAEGAVAVEEAQRVFDAALSSATSDAAITAALGELRLRPIDPEEPIGTLSGGEQTKLALIDAFAQQPDILLLDEPTNNLDLESAGWLDARLAAFVGPVVVVSHDRMLLDEHATSILELDPATRRAEVFPGNYSAYASEKMRRSEAQWAAYRRQQDHERRVRREISAIKSTASRREHLTQNDFYRRKAKKVARRAVVLERRLERRLKSNERIEKPVGRAYTILPQVAPTARGGDRMLSAEGLRLALGQRVLLDGASLHVGWGERVVMIGENGSGKTTLLRALVGEVAVGAGIVRRSPSLSLGYLPQEDSEAITTLVDQRVTPLTAIRAETELSETEARRFLHRFLFEGDAVHTPLADLSYGERRRLSLAKLVLGGSNLLVLDEPTNHLDSPSREALESALEDYKGAILAVTHDRYFIERFASRLLELRDRELSPL
jgi:ATP-binding cassette subfamily F protein 3